MSEEPIRNIDQAEDPANDAPPATSEPATDGEVKLQEAEAVKKVGGDALQDEDDKKEDVGASESPSDEDIVTKLREYLSADDMDFQKVTERQLRQKLEEHFGVSLKERKSVVKTEVVAWLENLGDAKGDEESDAPAGERRKTGLNVECQLSEPLQEFLGAETMARPQVVKAIWKYVKENNLQQEGDRRKINVDEKLSKIFTAPLGIFSMNKQLSKHIYTPEPQNQPGSSVKRKKTPLKTTAKKAKNATSEDKPKKANGFQKPVTLSNELSEFFGGVKELSRPEITKRFWAYFKENDLLNPANKREVLANEKLEELLGEKKFLAFGIQRLIKPHVVNTNGAVKAEKDTKSKKIISKKVEEEEDNEVEVSDIEED